MTRRTRVLAAVVIVISLPLMLAAFEAVAFHLANRSDHSIVSSGQTREYLLHVPRSYDPAKPTPLVISMHGAGGWPRLQMDISGWNRVADAEGLIVVYPSGLGNGGPRVWRPSDVQFIADLIDELARTHNIDRDRIFANGLSNGGGMSFVLSCTLSDRIAAIGMVGSAQTLPWSFCTDRRAVPMINFHGTADTFAPYEGGTSFVWERPFPDVRRWTANWARRNRCAETPIESNVAADVVRREYAQCANDATVVLYTIRGGGHTWPGGQQLPEWFAGTTNRSIDASREMWNFFRAHPRHRS